MSRLIHWDIPNAITKDILRDTFEINGNIVNIQLFSVDKTDSAFVLIDFCNKEEYTAIIKQIYKLKIHHLGPAIKLQFYKIDNGNKSLNTEMINNNTIYLHCKNIIQEFERTSNLEIIIYLLAKDQKSIIHTRHKEFIQTMSLKSLCDYHPIFTTKRNLIPVQIFQRKIISLTAYTHGISNAIEEWMNNNEVDSCIEMHALFFSIIISKCAISSKVKNLINTLVHFHHDFSFVMYVELLQSILKSTKNHDLKLILAENIDIVLNNISPKTLSILKQSFKMLTSKKNAMQIFVDAIFDKEVFILQQNNWNKLISSSIRSYPKLIDEIKNYSKMNVLIEKSISFNEPKNQEDCNNNQKNDTENTLHDFLQTPTPSKAISSQIVNKLVEKVPQSSLSSNAKASSQIVQKPVKICSSSTENSSQSFKSNKKNCVIGSNCVLQTIKKNETIQVKKKITNGVPICPANIILKKMQITIYSDEWKIKKHLSISCNGDKNNCLEKLDAIMNHSENNSQLSNPLMNISSSEPLINILSKSTLPNCHRKKKDTINNIFIDEKTFKKLIISEKNRYKKSVNISISGGAKVQKGELSDENIHIKCLAANEKIMNQILKGEIISITLDEPTNSHCPNHEIFIVSLIFVAMKENSTIRKEIGDMFTNFLSDKIFSITSITKGINRVLRNRSDFLECNVRPFMFAEIFVPLLISNCFEFSNVMDCMFDINKTECLITFIEILNKINNLEEHKNIKEYNGAVPWSCNKWNKSKHTESFIDFVSNTNLSLYLTSNGLDQTAILILSMAMHDVMRGSKNNMYFILTSWVKANLDIHIIGYSCFTRAIVIAVILVIINDDEFDGTFDDFFQKFHIMIFKHYVTNSLFDIQERELHCLYGIQTVCAALKYPENMLFKLFNKLYECQIVSKKSFFLWKNDEMCTSFPVDYETKSKAVSLSSSFFKLFNQRNIEKRKNTNI